ncbi:putative mitochondrial phosphate carrier [Cryptosporidium felis]|nr:putative mitochondrial phosphate carrier [Cryptosporidium felis]
MEKTKNADYYLNCAFGGALSCGLTHTAIVPIDIAKCRIQIYPGKYKGLISGLSTIVKEEGVQALKLGWAPTLIGYSAQGALKYGLYEYFKDLFSSRTPNEFRNSNKGLIWLGASAAAEFFADIALCPMEMLKLKIQTCRGTELWSGSFLKSLTNMYKYRAETKFPFGSITPLWSRQLPYTMAKFYFFEKINQLFYDKVFTRPKESYGKKTRLGITFLSGYLSGIVCAGVSHPADSMVSHLSKVIGGSRRVSIMAIIRQIGVRNLFTAGLGTRMIMIGTLTGMQWWVYDSFKAVLGFDINRDVKSRSKIAHNI